VSKKKKIRFSLNDSMRGTLTLAGAVTLNERELETLRDMRQAYPGNKVILRHYEGYGKRWSEGDEWRGQLWALLDGFGGRERSSAGLELPLIDCELIHK